MFDVTIHEFGRYRYNEMLQEAEEGRRRARLRRLEGIARNRQALLYLSQLLANAAAWLQARAEAAPSLAPGQRVEAR
ncbi:MAG: hypothetical protein KF832_03245 [Caldilineaceae bacterium]|nr:hypothetical protein [Caldilineaceae bacterium]